MSTARDKLVFEVAIAREKALDAYTLCKESSTKDGKESSRYSYLLAGYTKAWKAYRDVDSQLFLYDAENEGE